MRFRICGDRRVVAAFLATLFAAAAIAVAVSAGSASGAGAVGHGSGRGADFGPGLGRDHDHQKYTIGLFGDMPYGALGRSQYPNMLADVNHSHVAFSIFDGDLQAGGDGPRFLAVEPAACPTLTKGVYAYDYGDNWELTLRLEHVLPAAAGTPPAVAVDGRRAAPPEDCGGRRTADELAEVLEEPSRFDLGEVNEALQNPFIVLRDHGLDPRLAALIDRLTYSPAGEELASRALSLLEERPVPDEQALRASLTPFIWFLDRAAEGGIPLTASGYLKPADVTAAAEVLPTMHGWIGQANRESDTTPVLHFRKALQGLGLLRKHKGSLLLTRAGHDSHAAWQTLWNRLADRLVPNTDGFDTDATLLLLLYAATSPDSELPLDTIAAALTHLGWQSNDGTPIVGYDLYRLRAFDVLRNVSTAHVSRSDRWRIDDEVAELARAALRTL